jgi:hypothetical protein
VIGATVHAIAGTGLFGFTCFVAGVTFAAWRETSR